MARQNRPNPKTEPLEYSYASNNSPTQRVFEERLRYEDEVFPIVPNTVKTWTTHRTYGTISNRGNAVLPKVNRLKSLAFVGTDGESQFALDFVADAWYDLALRLRSLADDNIIFRNSPWSKPSVFKAWEPMSDTYDTYMRTVVFPRLVDDFIGASGNDPQITNINTFISKFDQFLQKDLILDGPITLSGLMEANVAPVYASGLIIEISQAAYDDDYNKGYEFLDKNFELVVNIASEYGFAIDENIPWRLVADLNNPAMLEYMLGVPITDFNAERKIEYDCEPYVGGLVLPPRTSGYSRVPGLESVRRHIAFFNYVNNVGDTVTIPGYRRYKTYVTAGDRELWVPTFSPQDPSEAFAEMFKTDFTETFYTDIDNFQQYLLDFYNYYAVIHPRAVIPRMVPTDGMCPPSTRSHHREQVTTEQFESLFSDRWKLKTFYILRTLERRQVLTVSDRRKAIQEALNFYNLTRFGGVRAPYLSALENIQNRMIGPVSVGPLTLDTVRDIIFS